MATRLVCDRCDKQFDTDAPPGEKVQCPFCHDVNIVRTPAKGTPADGPAGDRAAAAGYPPALGPEVEVLRVRVAMLRARPFSFLGLWCGLVGSCVAGVLFFALLPVAIGCGVVAVACLLALLVWKIKAMHDKLRITTRRIIDRTGLLDKNTSEILIKDIRHVVIRQSFWQRIWGVGELAISSAADDGVEIFMKDVPKPEDVKRVIDLYR